MRKVLSHEDLLAYEKQFSVYGFSKPLTCSYLFGTVGCEYCHTYFWIAKDLFWAQGHRDYSIFFGLSALLWSLIILWHALRTDNMHELWIYPSIFFWLFANFWWMAGEAHDYEYPYEEPIADQHTLTSCRLLTIAMFWLLIYYFLLLPLNILPLKKSSLQEYNDRLLQSRLPCFQHFRQYENLHMLFWIIKDLSWGAMNLTVWSLCLVPTILIAGDLVYISATSYNSPDYTVDLVHFVVVFVWVIGNSVWAFGDFFVEEQYADPQDLLTKSADSLMTARWWSSWILVANVVPIACLYSMWGWLTLTGKLNNTREDRGAGPRGATSASFCASVSNSTFKTERVDQNRQARGGEGSYIESGINRRQPRLEDTVKEWDYIRSKGLSVDHHVMEDESIDENSTLLI